MVCLIIDECGWVVGWFLKDVFLVRLEKNVNNLMIIGDIG